MSCHSSNSRNELIFKTKWCVFCHEILLSTLALVLFNYCNKIMAAEINSIRNSTNEDDIGLFSIYYHMIQGPMKMNPTFETDNSFQDKNNCLSWNLSEKHGVMLSKWSCPYSFLFCHLCTSPKSLPEPILIYHLWDSLANTWTLNFTASVQTTFLHNCILKLLPHRPKANELINLIVVVYILMLLLYGMFYLFRSYCCKHLIYPILHIPNAIYILYMYTVKPII